MRKRITKGIGVVLFCIGFVAVFAEISSPGKQVIWTLSAAAVMCIGAALIGKYVEEDEI